MVCDRVGVVEGEERDRLVTIQFQFEGIINELNDISGKKT
jgi:hypothetical protein